MEPGEQVTLNPQPIPPGIVWMTAAGRSWSPRCSAPGEASATTATSATTGRCSSSSPSLPGAIGVLAIVADIIIYIGDQT
jgi:hypothetical protein